MTKISKKKIPELITNKMIVQLTASNTRSRNRAFRVLQETSHKACGIGQTFIGILALVAISTKDRCVVGGYSFKRKQLQVRANTKEGFKQRKFCRKLSRVHLQQVMPVPGAGQASSTGRHPTKPAALAKQSLSYSQA